MKIVEIFGMTIKDYPLKESLNATRSFLHEPGLHTISYISREMLMEVADYPSQKKWIEDLDLAIFDEPIETINRTALSSVNHDGKSDDYLDMTLRNISALGASIYLVSDNSDNLENLRKTLNSLNGKLNLVGECVYNPDDKENMFNEINSLDTKIVLSCLPWMMQGDLMLEAKRMLETSIWLCFLPSFIQNKNGGIGSWFGNIVNQIKFQIKLNNYERQ